MQIIFWINEYKMQFSFISIKENDKKVSFDKGKGNYMLWAF